MNRELVQDAKELRPILVEEVSAGLDLLIRDRLRKTLSLSVARLQPRLPLIGTLPAPPPPPVFIPGKGMMSAEAFVDAFFPKLTDEQGVLLDTQVCVHTVNSVTRTLEFAPDVRRNCLAMQQYITDVAYG